MNPAFDDIDAFYDGTFDQPMRLGTDVTEYRAILSLDAGSFELLEPGQRKVRRATARVRRSELTDAPADRTVAEFPDTGDKYRVVGVDKGSTGLEWVLHLQEDY